MSNTDAVDPVGAAAPAVTAPVSAIELEVRAHRNEIVAKLATLVDDTRREATNERYRLKAKLAELAQLMKDHLPAGWTTLGATGRFELQHWIGR